MYAINKNNEEVLKKRNKLATFSILVVSLIISIVYVFLLSLISDPSIICNFTIDLFIRVFSVVLAIIAVASCILCYISNNKDEVFIISLMYMVFVIDITYGSFDSMVLTHSIINISDYITVSTSLIRISILMILIFPFNNTRRWIINNKIKSIVLVLILPVTVGILRLNGVYFIGIKSAKEFIAYNGFLVIVYVIFTIRFILKSIQEEEYIYAVLSASIFLFAIKATYAIVGVLKPSIDLKLVSISITYIGFIILIGGLLTELAFSIRRNKSLENENQLFYKLVDDSRYSFIIIYDENRKLKYVNKTLKEYLLNDKHASDEETEKEINKYIYNLGGNILNRVYKRLSKSDDWKGNIKINEDITLNCFIQKVYTYDGKQNIAIIFRDISHRIRAEKNLIEYEKLKNHETIKNEFFANVSHELRTPLNIFYSTIQLLDIKSKDKIEDFRDVYLNHRQCLKTNCQRMLRLINNIVDITKMDVGFTKAKFENCDIIRLVEDITLSVINYANPKNITITFDTEVEEHTIKCDPAMIERVMLNLLSNSIKFTKEDGNILVNTFVDEEWVHIRVKDNGIGIPLDIQSIIFERFIQSDKSLTRMNEGSGIGLSIVKSIVELNEGEIYLDSDGENGTEFEILLPNKVLEGQEDTQEHIYEVDMQKIQLELSDIYKLYK